MKRTLVSVNSGGGRWVRPRTNRVEHLLSLVVVSACGVVRRPHALRRHHRAALVLAGATLFVGGLFGTPARGQVSCADPDNLCTGDPCVITATEVLSPCIVDFGARTLIIDRLVLPSGGVASFSAASIEVLRGIVGRHALSGGNGADVSLIATGDIVVTRAIVTSGNATAGTILLQAGGNIDLRGALRSRAAGAAPTATGGIVQVEAGGTLTTTAGARIEVYSRKTAGGQATLRGATGVVLNGRTRAYGTSGGTVEMSSTLGTVTINHEVSVRGLTGAGGSVLVSGAAGATIARGMSASGEVDGGTILVSSAAGAAVVDEPIFAHGSSGTGGMIALTGATSATASAALSTRGRTAGGTVLVSSPAGTVTIAKGSLRADSSSGAGGMVTVNADGPVVVFGGVKTQGKTAGGPIQVSSASGAVTIESDLNAEAHTGAGGNVTVSAASTATVSAYITADGGTGGSVTVSGATADVTGPVRADGDAGGGSIVVTGLSGDVTIDGYLRTRGGSGQGGSVLVDAASNLNVSQDIDATGNDGGSIQVSAAAVLTVEEWWTDVTAQGVFAGGSVDLQGASVVIGPGVGVNVSGSTAGGEMRCQALAGDLAIDGDFEAKGGGGVLEGLAPAGDLTAAGTFTTGGGCIGLSAGGTLDTSGATFDGPVSASCP